MHLPFPQDLHDFGVTAGPRGQNRGGRANCQNAPRLVGSSLRALRRRRMQPLAPCVLWGSPPTLPNIHLVEVLPECGVLATASDAGVVLWQLPQGSEGEGAADGAEGAARRELELRPYALLFPPRRPGRRGLVNVFFGMISERSGDVKQELAKCMQNWIRFCTFREVARNSDQMKMSLDLNSKRANVEC